MSDNWTTEHEKILKEWKAKAFINLWLQNKSAYHYAFIHNILSYPIIILSSVSSATIFSTDNIIIKYAVGSVSIVTGVLTALTRQLKPGELYQQYSQTSKKYQLLLRNIDTCLDLPQDMRPKPEVFIEKVGTDIDTLSTTQLYPPISVIKQFEKKYNKLDLLMFGEDIAELMKQDNKNSNIFNKLLTYNKRKNNYIKAI